MNAPTTSGTSETAVAIAKALSDPIRLRMLQVLAAGRAGCCTPSPADSTLPPEPPEGVCVCELQALFGLAQSRASYHLRILREAGLVRETTRGKWNFYRLDEAALQAGLAALAQATGVAPQEP
jgi:ArsR family transcriptional regulator